MIYSGRLPLSPGPRLMQMYRITNRNITDRKRDDGPMSESGDDSRPAASDGRDYSDDRTNATMLQLDRAPTSGQEAQTSS